MNEIIALAATPPSLGSALPGNLYADLQSRTLWLGVDPAVDPAGSVLVSDIVSLQSSITTGDNASKAYTDSQITTRAPTVHTHTSSQITDFATAVTAVATGIPSLSYVRGMVLMYSGLVSDIGVGGLAGWALCDGTLGTPDLRDKFIIGAGSRAVGSVNSTASFNSGSGGSHIHTVNGTAITVAQMPQHDHGTNSGNNNTSHDHALAGGTTDSQGNHVHGISNNAYRVEGNGWPGLLPVGGDSAIGSGPAGFHTHNLTGRSGFATAAHYHNIANEGGDGTHTHTIVSGSGIHADHLITSLQLRDAIPFYALAFIMRL